VITVTPHIIRSAEITSNDNLALLGGTISQGGQGAGMNPSVEEVLLRAQLEEESDRRLIAMQNAIPTQPQAPTSPLLQASQPNPLTVAQSNPALPQTALRNVGNFPDTSLNGPIGNAPAVKPVPTAEPNKTVINMKGDGSASPALAPETKAIQMTGTPDVAMAPVAPTAIPGSPAAAAAAEWAKQFNKTEAQLAAEEAALIASTEPNAAEADKTGKPKENQPVQPAIPLARVVQVTPPEHVQRAIQEAQLRAAKEREAARANPKPVQPEPEFKSEYFPPPAVVSPAAPRGVAATNAKAKPNDSGIVGESGFNTASIRGNQPLVRVANLNLSAAQKSQSLGKTLAVNLQLDAPMVLTNGTVALTFDASKLKVKAVKDGGMFSKPLDITFTETPGVVTINVNAANLKAAKNSGRLLVVEFETIGEGTSEIAISGAETQMRLSGEPASVNATSTQVLIAREK
jgi:hypothetical protein